MGRVSHPPRTALSPELENSLRLVFKTLTGTRVNEKQWKLLLHRCGRMASLANDRFASPGNRWDPAVRIGMFEEDLPRSESDAGSISMLLDAFKNISLRAQRYNEMEQTTEFFQFEAISREIKGMFSTLDRWLVVCCSFTEEVAQLQWIHEFRTVQEQELAVLATIREKFLGKNRDPETCDVGWGNVASKRVETLRSKGMSAQEMFEALKRHGCQDLSDRVDMKTILTRAVAAGAYGDIFKGSLDDGTDIAIKVWSFRRADEAPHKSLKGAMRELYNWSKADHVNVQKLLGVVMFNGRLGMVSRWMGNGNLQDYIRKHQPKDRYQLCMQVAKAVQHLHREQMVHGDLKASNFLVSSDGVLKLTDFDHSIISCHSIVFSKTTTMGGGTMRWMAPELVMDEGEVELRSTQADVYALGMTILEIITGAVPYVECPGDSQVFCKLMDKALPEGKEQFKDTRGGQMWDLLVQCWDHDPALRPSADKVVNSLRALIPAIILPNEGV